MLLGIALSTGAAISWGASDFFGGAARRATPVFVIVAAGELLGLVLLVPVLAARGIAPPDDPRLLLAAVAGVGVTVELGFTYLALSRGEAFITAPVGALGAAIAITVGLIGGDPLDLAIALGLVCSLAGGAVSAWSSGVATHGRTGLGSIGVCAGAAAGLATMLISFHAAGRVDPYWATVIEHASTAVSAGMLALIGNGGRLRRRLPGARQLPALALIAVTGVGGDLAYAAASQRGTLSVVSAISSLYPIATIALGVMLQRRRAGSVQMTGVVLALIGAAVLGAATP